MSCPTPIPSYSSEVSTIFLAHCVMCHQASGVESSMPLDTYATVFAQRSAVLDQVYTCKMPQPPQPSLSDSERESLLAWLVCNAPPELALLALALAACGGGANATREQMLDPTFCGSCHTQHLSDWSGSMHAYASIDPVFRAMNQKGQRDTAGALGGFCVNCHAPMAVSEKATTDGLNLDQVPSNLQGVGCFFCHSVDAVTDTHNNPLTIATDLTIRGPFSDPVATVHKSEYSTLHDRDKLDSATLCGSCHDVVTGHGAQLERTFAEWKASVFSQPTIGETCGQCHMAQSTSPEVIANTPGLSPRRVHSHTFAAVDVALSTFPNAAAQQSEIATFLNNTLQTGLCVTDGQPRIQVLLDNVAAGHDFPSGAAQDRRLWAQVQAFAGDQMIYQSGMVADGASEAVPGDTDLWQMRECIFDTTGAETHDFWNAATYSANTLPGSATFDMSDPRFYQGHIVKKFPQTGQLTAAPDRVVLQMRMRPMSLDVLDELIASGDLDAGIRAQMPTFNVGAPLQWTADAGSIVSMDNGFPVSCVSATNLTLAFNATPATDKMSCSP